MFFQKKKDKDKEASSGAAAAAGGGDKKKDKKEKKKEKDKAEPLSKEEMERLEETKSRLFGGLGRASGVSIGVVEVRSASVCVYAGKKKANNNSDGAPRDSRTKPEPPPRSQLLKDLPPHNPPPVPPPIGGSGSDQKSTPLPSLWTSSRGPLSPSSLNAPSSPFDAGNESSDFGFHPLKTFNLPGLSLPVLAKTNLEERTLTLKRTSAGWLHFSLLCSTF